MLHVELLEPRLAPSSTLTFTDVDGDRVTITSTRGNLAGRATLAAVGAGQQLVALDLTDPAFQGTAIATAVTRVPGGDGLVNIGRIDATGRDLATVTVKGDLGAIDAGDGDPAAPALKVLTVRSMGRYGLATQGGTGDLVSDFDGALGRLTVAGDVREATIDVTDTGGETGKLGPVVIGGSLVGGAADQTGRLFARDGMARVTVRGDVVGGAGAESGVINCATALAGVTIGGSLRGGPGALSGAIFSDVAAVGPVQVGREMTGGAGVNSGWVFGQTGIVSVTVGRSLIGGTADDSGKVDSNGAIGPVRIAGDVLGGRGVRSGSVEAPQLGRVTVGGSVVGGPGSSGGSVESFGDLGPVTIGGDLVGGSLSSGRVEAAGRLAGLAVGGSVVGAARASGRVHSGGDLGPVRIGRDLVGGTDRNAGTIESGGRLAALTVGGSVRGGTSEPTGGVLSGGDMGPVRIGGDVVGGSGSVSGYVDSRAGLAGVTVNGSVLGGTNFSTGTVTSAGDLGPVVIGRDLRGGSISGALPDLLFSGHIHGARIASVLVGGSVVSGTDTSTAGALSWNASIGADRDLGPVVVRGSLVGNANPLGYSPVVISGRGQAAAPPGATTDLAIKSLTVGGHVEYAQVLAGVNYFQVPVNGNASVGTVTVGGDWVASSVAAGVRAGADGWFGTPDDVVINNATDEVVARIASVSIGGIVAGSGAPGDHYGFVAQQVGSFRAGAYVAPLTAGADVIELSPTTADVTVREV